MASPEIVRVLHSGFVAYDSSFLKQIPKQDRVLVQAITDHNTHGLDHDNCYDKEVAELWSEFCKNQDAVKDILYRERLIVATKRLFDDVRIDTWIKLQLKMNTVSYSHERFLIETLEYVYFGKCRPLSHDMYYHILSPKNDDAGAKEHDIKRKQYRSLLDILASFETIETRDFIGRYISDYEKVSDLVRTLNVIFGCRNIATVYKEQ